MVLHVSARSLAMSICAGALLLTGCAIGPERHSGCDRTRPGMPLHQNSFNAYQAETTQWVQQRRVFQTADHQSETQWNSPLEWRPAGGPPRKGVLLVHGLGDSPWSFVDIGQHLARQGFLVRTVLLPGHGTQPADMIDVQAADWREVVEEQAAVLRRDVGKVYLGGFSTGANLALAYALDHEADVSGLLLFSPALKSRVGIDWVAPWVVKAKTWLRSPDDGDPQQTPLRYLNVPTNGFAQFYQTSVSARERLAAKAYSKPTLLVTAAHDSVVDVAYLRSEFPKRFVHPASRMIWYGDIQTPDSRTLAKPDRIEALRISQFSHMSVLFSPENPVYGVEGSQRLCWNGQSKDGVAECERGAEVWYSDWGYSENGKYHARLTFNPYFSWQSDVMDQVLAAAD